MACAPSNIAVDNLVERLAASRVKVVRLGHPARLVSSVLPHSLDSLLDRYDGSDVVKDIRKELNEAMVRKLDYQSFVTCILIPYKMFPASY